MSIQDQVPDQSLPVLRDPATVAERLMALFITEMKPERIQNEIEEVKISYKLRRKGPPSGEVSTGNQPFGLSSISASAEGRVPLPFVAVYTQWLATVMAMGDEPLPSTLLQVEVTSDGEDRERVTEVLAIVSEEAFI